VFFADQVSVAYRREPVFEITAELGPEPVAIMGPSGSGKSTFLRLLAGTQRPDRGIVTLNGIKILEPSWHSSADRRIALVHQDYRLVEFLSVVENLLLATEVRGLKKGADDAVAVLDRLGLSNVDPDRKPGTLSGGEQQRVAIARALVCESAALLADEPSGALDAKNTDLITDLILQIGAETAMQIVVATHDPRVADRFPQRYALDQGALRRLA
jgi:ABC-type lipoprotein export system ATPase subunit